MKSYIGYRRPCCARVRIGMLSMVCLRNQQGCTYALHRMSIAEYCEALLERFNRQFSVTTSIQAAFDQYGGMAQIRREAELPFFHLCACKARQVSVNL